MSNYKALNDEEIKTVSGGSGTGQSSYVKGYSWNKTTIFGWINYYIITDILDGGEKPYVVEGWVVINGQESAHTTANMTAEDIDKLH